MSEKFIVSVDLSTSAARAVFVISAADGTAGTKVVQQITFQLEDMKIGRFGLGFNIEPIENTIQEQEAAKIDK